MFLHIGGNYYTDISDIICIFDLRNSHKMTTDNFLENVSDIIYICDRGKEVSAVVVAENNGFIVYMTDTAVTSIGRRRYGNL